MLTKFNLFLKYLALFLLLASVLSFVVIAVIYMFNPTSFCYEVVDNPLVSAGNLSFYVGDRVSDCVVVTSDELADLSFFYRSRLAIGVACFVGWLVSNPDFWLGLKEKFNLIEKFK